MDIETRLHADLLKSKGVRRVRYFHCDHFEPWSRGVNPVSLRGLDRFRTLSAASRYGRRISLFYCNFVPRELDETGTLGGLRVPGEPVAFFSHHDRAPQTMADMVAGIRPLVDEGEHEMHLHVHHEWWTRNAHSLNDPIWRWVQANSTAEADEARLRLFLRISTDMIAAEIGRPFNRWGFVHGNWALCASDEQICTIETEMRILMDFGGWGDFTFPAGRGHCDSHTERPFTCLPVSGKRAFDLPEARQELVAAGARALRPERFFIWNSPIKARYSSLDWYYQPNVDLFRKPWRMIDEWINRSVVFGDTLYLKTHAHSMNTSYNLGESDAPIPHTHPDVVALFETFERVCDAAGVAFECVTVNEVMEDLAAIDGAAPAGSFVVPRPRPIDVLGKGARAAEDAMSATLVPWINGDSRVAEAAGEYYARPAREERRIGLRTYEIAAADYIRRRFDPKATQIVEIGAGYGLLAGIVAEAGFDVLAVEGATSRLDGMKRALAALATTGAKTPQVREGYFPQCQSGDMIEGKGRSVVLMTNIVHSSVADNRDSFIRACLAFDDVIVDVAHFGKALAAGAERDALAAALTARLGPGNPVFEDAHHLLLHFAPAPLRVDDATPRLSRASSDVDRAVAAVNAARAGLPADVANDPSYTQRIERGLFVDPVELAAALAFLEKLDMSRTLLVEIGSGQGGLAATLAMLGHVVLGYEGVAARVAVANAVAEALRPQLGARLAFRHGLFPRNLAPLPGPAGGRRAAFVGNIVATYSAERQDRILRALCAFDDVLIETSRFGVNRDAPEQRDAFLRALSAERFDVVDLVLRAKTIEYWRLRPKRVIPE